MFDSALLFFWVESARSALVHVYAPKNDISNYFGQSNNDKYLQEAFQVANGSTSPSHQPNNRAFIFSRVKQVCE